MFRVIGGIEVEGDPVDGRDGYADEPELPVPVLLLLPVLPLPFTTGGGPTTPAAAEAASRVPLTFFRCELSIAAETPPLSESSSSNLIVLAPLGSGGTPAALAAPGSPGNVCWSDAPALARRERERLRRSATRASATARSSSVTFVICTSRSGSSYSYTVGAPPEDDGDADAEDEREAGGRWVWGCDWGCTTTTPTLTRT